MIATPDILAEIYRNDPDLLQQFNGACSTIRNQIQELVDTNKPSPIMTLESIAAQIIPPVKIIQFVPELPEPDFYRQTFSPEGAVVELELSVDAFTPLFTHAHERMQEEGISIPDHPNLGEEDQNQYCITALILASAAEDMNGRGIKLPYPSLVKIAESAAQKLFG